MPHTSFTGEQNCSCGRESEVDSFQVLVGYIEGLHSYEVTATMIRKDNPNFITLLRYIKAFEDETRQYAHLRGTWWYKISDVLGLIPKRWKRSNLEV